MEKFLVVLFLLVPQLAFAVEKPIPRQIVALYDSRFMGTTARTTFAHNLLEMPANHIGYDVNYYDIKFSLPKLDDNVAGVIIWFNPGEEVPNPAVYIRWIKENIVQKHKKLIIIENGGISEKYRKDPKIAQAWSEVLGYIGVNDEQNWDRITYQSEIAYIDNKMVGFERKIAPPFPPISVFHALSGNSQTHLRMHLGDALQDKNADLVITNPNGGFIAENYAIFSEKLSTKAEYIREWIINPFRFLRETLKTQTFPIPDVTTLNGRRIFYSHIDGDGWNNISEIDGYRESGAIASAVIYSEILEAYNDFPFSVALITGDVDPKCAAALESEKVARNIFALPNVEPSSHTYSHPFYWDFFKDYKAQIEKSLPGYNAMNVQKRFSLLEKVKRKILKKQQDIYASDRSIESIQKELSGQDNTKGSAKYNIPSAEAILKEYNYMPRSYACSNYNLDKEISGSVAVVKSLSPANKKIGLIQWSGDTSPYEEAIAATRKSGLLNINGGDSRFDKEFPSYSFVAPIGIKIGKERQIYSSDSNEETYTLGWHDRFYGYRYLQQTVTNTDKPVRLSPFNIYFHMFSGEKLAALNAIKENLEFARTQDIIPIVTSDYAAIAEGFYTATIIPVGEHTWRIENRGALQTLRFDNADALNVDMSISKGVMGQYHYQGSLYVALDPGVETPLLSLTPQRSHAKVYLLQSNWHIQNLTYKKDTINFNAKGYGQANITLQAGANEKYVVKMHEENKKTQIFSWTSKKGVLHVYILPTMEPKRVDVIIKKVV